MDVERVQKINSLAMDLVNQGLAADKEEAIKQAEQILAKKDYSSLNNQVSEVKGEIGGVENTTEQTPELGQEKIKEILQKNTEFIVKRMKQFNDQFLEMNNSFDALRGEIDIINGRIKELQMARSNTPEKTQTPEKPPQEQPPAESNSDHSKHPRSGNFKDQEVSIEKFFYSGSKSK